MRKLREWLASQNPIIYLWIAYLIFVIIHVIINGYCKHIETYMDEWVYYGQAECLAKGMGFPKIYGGTYTSGRYLYPLLISPAFLTANRLLQFRLVAMINAMMVGSGIFPVYLLAKDTLEKKNVSVVLSVLYLCLPDMHLTASFNTENLFLPLALWTIFFSCRFFNSRSMKESVQTAFFFFISSILAMLTKRAGILFVICFAVLLLILKIMKVIHKTKNDVAKSRKTLLFSIILCAASVFFLTIFIRYAQDGYFYKNIRGWTIWIWQMFQKWSSLYVYTFFYMFVSEAIAIGIFPFVVPILCFSRFKKKAKVLYAYLLMLLTAFNIGSATTSLYVTERYGTLSGFTSRMFLYQRYVLFVWIPLLIVFVAAMIVKNKINLKEAVFVTAFTLICTLMFRGSLRGSAFDCSMLYWSENWLDHRKIWVIVSVVLIVIGMYLWNRKKRGFVIFFSSILAFLLIWNHVSIWTTIKGAYEMNYNEIGELESFVQEHPEESFLVVAAQSDAMVPNYEAKVADTFLVYPNTYRVSRDSLLSYGEMDLKDQEAMIPGASPLELFKLESVDYMIVTRDILVDKDNCKEVEGISSSGFLLYKLRNKTLIPEIGSWDDPSKGIIEISADDGYFYSGNTDSAGQMIFETTDACSPENPEWILYGPYLTLSPGKYKITVFYDAGESNDASETIGMMDLNGSEINSDETQKELSRDERESAIEIELPDGTEGFEIRVLASAPGVEIKKIRFEHAP